MTVAGRRPRREAGTVTPLLLAFAVCLGLLIAAVTDVSAAYLRRQAAASVADGAALSASDAAAAASVYAGESRRFVPIDEEAARHAVLAYLDDSGAAHRYPGLRTDVQVLDGRTIVVDLAMPYDLPISIPGSRDSVVIRVESSAEVPVY
jgi:hypothetical protein